jgi:hypothetical protein
MSDALEKTETLLFEKYVDYASCADTALVFIVASPRTGSTLIYQMLINLFDFFYFSNFVAANYAEFPAVGAALDLLANPRQPVDYQSNHGKTRGDFGPSEASAVFRNWFGGFHPSQLRSAEVLFGKKEHMLFSLNAIFNLTRKPILTKNAWNCFRIKEVSRMLPNLLFIWVRRDIAKSAVSDLEARYRRGGPNIWNSATTANYQEIQRLPYWEQVVEQQYEYNRSLGEDLRTFGRDRYVEVWYEDLCANPARELERLNNHFLVHSFPATLKKRQVPKLELSRGPSDLNEDYSRVVQYVKANADRFREYLFNEVQEKRS